MTEQINQSMNRNTGKQCKATGCYNPRRNLGGYCKQHYRKAYLYGDPNGKAILTSDFKREFIDVSKLIDDNLEHPAVLASCSLLKNWLDLASNGKPCISGVEVSKVALEAKPIDILKATSALWLFADRNPSRFIDDQSLTYQLGITFLKCAKYKKTISYSGKIQAIPPNGKVRRAIGQNLRDTLGLFYVNIASHFKTQENAELKLKKDMYVNF
jgi:hypothetical protein